MPRRFVSNLLEEWGGGAVLIKIFFSSVILVRFDLLDESSYIQNEY